MNKKIATDSASPSLKGGKGWVSTLLKIIIAMLTAIAGTLGISAMA